MRFFRRSTDRSPRVPEAVTLPFFPVDGADETSFEIELTYRWWVTDPALWAKYSAVPTWLDYIARTTTRAIIGEHTVGSARASLSEIEAWIERELDEVARRAGARIDRVEVRIAESAVL